MNVLYVYSYSIGSNACVCCLFLYTTKPAINATATITTTIIDASTHHIHGLVPDPETLALFDGVIVVELFPATVVFVDMDTVTVTLVELTLATGDKLVPFTCTWDGEAEGDIEEFVTGPDTDTETETETDTETDAEADADVAFTKDTELDGVGEVAFGEGDALIEADGDKVDVLPFKAQPASAHILNKICISYLIN